MKHSHQPEQSVGRRDDSAKRGIWEDWWQVYQSPDGFGTDVKVGDSGEIKDASQGMIFVFALSYGEVKFLKFRVIDSTVCHYKQ